MSAARFFGSSWKLSHHEKFGLDDGHLVDIWVGRIDETISI